MNINSFSPSFNPAAILESLRSQFLHPVISGILNGVRNDPQTMDTDFTISRNVIGRLEVITAKIEALRWKYLLSTPLRNLFLMFLEMEDICDLTYQTTITITIINNIRRNAINY